MGGSSKGHIQMGGSSKGHIQMGGSDFDTFTGVHLLTDGRFQYRPFTDGRFHYRPFIDGRLRIADLEMCCSETSHL